MGASQRLTVGTGGRDGLPDAVRQLGHKDEIENWRIMTVAENGIRSGAIRPDMDDFVTVGYAGDMDPDYAFHSDGDRLVATVPETKDAAEVAETGDDDGQPTVIVTRDGEIDVRNSDGVFK